MEYLQPNVSVLYIRFDAGMCTSTGAVMTEEWNEVDLSDEGEV